ncbi:unnamed protein product [Darwinula stevensoni]|uniref:Uncharacterized protein n=1 Tax=Darwinula stevensoni TaxID=69355 RepID=A0A7R9A2T5_9CRUS|nr:unnamed protein product [Darwinula stevensoni]CAG0889328.1 unnamed protein product [Darwinula stevensoni]
MTRRGSYGEGTDLLDKENHTLTIQCSRIAGSLLELSYNAFIYAQTSSTIIQSHPPVYPVQLHKRDKEGIDSMT